MKRITVPEEGIETLFGSYDENSRAFRVYKLTSQDIEVALEVTDVPAARGATAQLVRSSAGDALAIWVRGTGWFVHPIDLDGGSVEAPFVVTAAQLSSMPKPCAEHDEGFVLSGPVSPEPWAELPAGMSLRAIEGRFRVSALGVCLDALAAQGEAGANGAKSLAAALRATGRPTVSATLTERKPLGRRIERQLHPNSAGR